MGSTETLSLAFDVSGDLADAETVQSATATLINRQSGLSYLDGLVGSPTISIDGTIITQIVSDLQPEKHYRLVISFIVSAGVKEPAAVLNIDCPF